MGREVIAPLADVDWQRILAETGYSSRRSESPTWARLAERSLRGPDRADAGPPPLPPCCRVPAYSTCAACPGGACESCLPREAWSAHINGTCACRGAGKEINGGDPSWAARVARALARAEWSVN